MKVKEALEKLAELEKKRYAYGAASSALYLDGATVAPKDTAAGRGLAQSVLAGERHKLFTSPETEELLTVLEEHREELDSVRRRQTEELRRSCDEIRRIPAAEYMEYAMLKNEAGAVWHRAKEQDDFELFRPVLEKMVSFSRRLAGYYDAEKAPYDALLSQYERGMSMEILDPFFAALRQRTAPLIQAIGQQEPVDASFLHRRYPVEAQKQFSGYLMELLGLDRRHCGIGETEHPFTLGFNNKDVRLTTNYHEDNLAAAMYSVLHEGGHAKYELGIGDELQFTCLGGAAAMSIHESQSRFYENYIGRSLPFIQAIFPRMQAFFPQQLQGVTAEQFYRAVNKVQPSLIRIRADELTYSLHIMIRYEIEKLVIDGSLAVRDIPGTWNRMYQEYLGVQVPSNREGCLQDSHWSSGYWGYFPAYSLGSAYAAQMLKNMEADIDVWAQVSRGDLSGAGAWLGEKVHRYGRMLEPADLIQNACGAFDPAVYTDYLVQKYTGLYGLA